MEEIKTLSEKDITPLREVHTILSKKDALTVFLKVAGGLKSDLDTPGNIGLTKKQYYTRLKRLVDLGLAQKNGEVYTLTTLGGKICQSQILGLAGTLRNSKKYQMIDVLRKDSKFEEKDIEKLVSSVD